MTPARFDIYLARVPWLGCHDARPWLITEILKDGYTMGYPISAQCYSGPCFEIDETHFRECGLSKPCYIQSLKPYPIRPDELVKRRGALRGTLEFRKKTNNEYVHGYQSRIFVTGCSGIRHGLRLRVRCGGRSRRSR